MNRMTELLERINYDLPGLKKAKMCYAQGDADGAMDAVIEHFRTRITPKYLFTAKEMEQCKVDGILEDAQETLDHYNRSLCLNGAFASPPCPRRVCGFAFENRKTPNISRQRFIVIFCFQNSQANNADAATIKALPASDSSIGAVNGHNSSATSAEAAACA